MRDTEQPPEETVVEWDAPIGGPQTVEVNPYTGKITVNDREFDITKLCSEDVPDWLYRSVDTDRDRSEDGDSA